MPIPIIVEVVFHGIRSVPFLIPVLKTLSGLLLIYLLKVYFNGFKNTSERLMHSKIVMITVIPSPLCFPPPANFPSLTQGGTSGIGASVAHALASRGAQVILLTHHAPSDPFLVDYIDDLRTSTNNNLIYAEQVNLASLHSIRLFATKWVDNAPPRRLDLIILCADTMAPRFSTKTISMDNLDSTWQINYLANFHLLSILSPALRAQPADRDVRVIFTTCASYLNGDLKALKETKDPLPVGKEYATSKLASMTFASMFQKHLDAYARPDKQPNNARVVLVDPGLTRTPGFRRWISMGSLWGLLLYLLLWPLWWLVLKSPEQGAQTILMAAMEAELGKGVGGRMLKEGREVEIIRGEVRDEKAGGGLWGASERMIEKAEKEGAVRRALLKKEKEKATETEKAEAERKAEQEKTKEKEGEKAPGSRRSRKAGL